jgi:hypothetical protein
MVVTDRVLHILLLLRTCKYLSSALIRQYCVPTDRDGAVTREVLRKMLRAGLCARSKAETVDPLANSTAPVYLPTVAGSAVLATMKRDMALQLDCDPPRTWQHYSHYVAVSQFLLMLRAAVEPSPATLGSLILEHDLIADREQPDRTRRLFTVVQDDGKRKIVCNPDALFSLQLGKFSVSYYLEFERGTNTPGRAAAMKAPGFALLQETQGYRKHLPDASRMAVLAVCPNAAWRDAMRDEMQKHSGKELWRFLARDEVTPENLLTGKLLHACDGQVRALFAGPPAATPFAPPMPEPREESRKEAMS